MCNTSRAMAQWGSKGQCHSTTTFSPAGAPYSPNYNQVPPNHQSFHLVRMPAARVPYNRTYADSAAGCGPVPQTLELQWGDPNGHFVEWTIDIGCGGMADVRVRSCHCCYSYCVVPPSPTCLGSGPSFSSISHPDSEGAPAPAPAPATAGTRKTEPVYTPGASAQDHDDHDGVDWDREAPRRCRHRDRATKNSNLKRCPGQDLDRADQRRCRNRDWARAAKRRCRDRAQYRAAKTGGAATGGSQY